MFGLFCFEEPCCCEYSYPRCLVNMCTSFSWLYICEWSCWVERCAHVQCYWVMLHCYFKGEIKWGLAPTSSVGGVHYSISLFHILLLLDILRLKNFCPPDGSEWNLIVVLLFIFLLLMNISPYIMGIHFASCIKCLFISFDYELLVPSWVVCLFLVDIEVISWILILC